VEKLGKASASSVGWLTKRRENPYLKEAYKDRGKDTTLHGHILIQLNGSSMVEFDSIWANASLLWGKILLRCIYSIQRLIGFILG
jgi:hypothetical protein